MKIAKAGDLMHTTYFMIDWTKEKQMPSDQTCSQCGKLMNMTEQAVDSEGRVYDGYVCHVDKRLIWVRGR